jgi:ribose transport system permease protein
LTAGIAAMIMLGYYGSASSDVGKGYELDVIAASVVGGASFSGGKGSALGALLGALVIQMINNSIVILGIDQNYSQVIMGSVIILAVLIDQVGGRFQERRMKRIGGRPGEEKKSSAPNVQGSVVAQTNGQIG